MMEDLLTAKFAIETISQNHNIPVKSVVSVLELLNDGCTVPFIARYRKSETGSLDETDIIAIRDELEKAKALADRREAVLNSCRKTGVLTEALKKAILEAATLADLEDVYLPYRPKRTTRGQKAKERGLEALAVLILKQGDTPSLEAAAGKFRSEASGVPDVDSAVNGALDIIAEYVAEHAPTRAKLRKLFFRNGEISASKCKNQEDVDASKYDDYYEGLFTLANIPAYRVHALFRAEHAGCLTLKIAPQEDMVLRILENTFVRGDNEKSALVQKTLKDSYRRLIQPALETEVRKQLKETADVEAITVFAKNLKSLLLKSPFGSKAVIGVDPGFKSGCKIAAVSALGELLSYATIYPHQSSLKEGEAREKILALIDGCRPAAIAVGNGTAGRETVAWLNGLSLSTPVVTVSESGASVYSASDIAREEFPELDLTIRSAVSIARRLQDPLAELVKVDPKSIGVGQYQHDVDQKLLRQSLDDAVLSAVNGVGVDLNSASLSLLKYVSGLNAVSAKNILEYRRNVGQFRSREELLKVPRLGQKTFQQCAGFLRIADGVDPLDATAIHPENYQAVRDLAASMGCNVAGLLRNRQLLDDIPRAAVVGLDDITLNDIIGELNKPGRDPRSTFEFFAFSELVTKFEDLAAGMKLPGVVSNVTDFGIFVDVGVHQDGLIHRKQTGGRGLGSFSPGDYLTVEVVEVDGERRRIALRLSGGIDA